MPGNYQVRSAAARAAKPRLRTLKGKKLQHRQRIANYFSPRTWAGMFLLTLGIIMVFGLVVLFSASYAPGYYYHEDSYYFIRSQLFNSLLGISAMIFVSFIDYHILRRFWKEAYALTLFLLAFVVYAPSQFTLTVNGCTRWIKIWKLPSVQPSEIAKMAVIMVMAYLLTKNASRLKNPFIAIVSPMLFLLPILFLLHKEPHNSAMMLMIGITVMMLFVGGIAWRWVIGGGLSISALCVVFILSQKNYVASRLSGWLDPFSDVLGDTLQIAQSLYTIGNGGLLGVGIGNSSQKQLWLPEATNDFIFSVLCEELGFVGAVACILLFVALIVQGLRIASRATDNYGALLVVGIISQITLQVMLNVAVVTNSMPNTGISLPFFSSGGTSLIMLLAEIGVVLNVHRQSVVAEMQQEQEQKQKDLEHQQAMTSMLSGIAAEGVSLG